MPKGRPFLFCHYTITVDDEVLSGKAQATALSELQGRPAPHGRKAAEEGHLDTIIMRPRPLRVSDRSAIMWSVGHIVDTRVVAKYNRARDELDFEEIDDGSVRYSDFVAVPALGVMAVDDRGGEMHLGGRPALRRFRSVIRMLEGADASMEFDVSPDEVRRALKDWSLTKFRFTIQPSNPRPVGRLGQELSEQFKRDGIGKVVGAAYPADPARMQMADDGFIEATTDLVDAGYGQASVAGMTPDGVEAEIKKPRFDANVERNEAIQAKPRELRVFVDDEELTDEETLAETAKSLIRFYGDG